MATGNATAAMVKRDTVVRASLFRYMTGPPWTGRGPGDPRSERNYLISLTFAQVQWPTTETYILAPTRGSQWVTLRHRPGGLGHPKRLSGWRPGLPTGLRRCGPRVRVHIGNPHHRAVQHLAAERAREGGVPVGEHPAVGRHQEVAPTVGGRDHSHDGLVQWLTACRAEELCVAEREDPAVGGRQPVALSVGGGSHPHNWGVQGLTAHRAEEVGIAEAEEAAVGRYLPVAQSVRGRGHPDDGLVERLPAHRAEELGVTEGEDSAIGAR